MSRVCVSREYSTGRSFNAWLPEPNHTYVGLNLNKYSKGELPDSKWEPLHIFNKHPQVSYETKLFYYEQYIRKYQFDNLHELYAQKLGCFCRPTRRCHADILLRLVKESFVDTVEEMNSPFPIPSPNLLKIVEEKKKDEETPTRIKVKARRRLFTLSDDEEETILTPFCEMRRKQMSFEL